jgi:hypothetical protein
MQSTVNCSQFFTVWRATTVARRLFFYAWHVAQSRDFAAQALIAEMVCASHRIIYLVADR